MRTAVFGSWREGSSQWGLRGTYDDFVKACEMIGREFARKRQAVIVGGEASSTADIHIVRGIVKEAELLNIQTELIEVIQPGDNVISYQQLALTHPHLFVFHTRTWQNWAETHLIQLDQADAVLTIAGMKGTLHVGLAAVVAKKPIVPIASFGGASAKLMKALEAKRLPADISELRQLNKPWRDDLIEVVFHLLGIKDPLPIQVGNQPLPRVFIGSSVEGLEIAYEIQSQLRYDAVCVIWNQGTVFGLGTATLEALEKAVNEYDFSIFVFSPDDQSVTRGQTKSVARDNVIFELGLFIGRHSRMRSFVVHPSRNSISLPSDLSGLITAAYDPDNPIRASAVGPACHLIRLAIKSAMSTS